MTISGARKPWEVVVKEAGKILTIELQGRLNEAQQIKNEILKKHRGATVLEMYFQGRKIDT